MLSIFGGEWKALQNDPEFKYFTTALDDFLVIKNIKLQRERDFERDPDLKRFYARAKAKVGRRFNNFVEYLLDPSSRYPEVKQFEEPASPKYPRKYNRVKLCAS